MRYIQKHAQPPASIREWLEVQEPLGVNLDSPSFTRKAQLRGELITEQFGLCAYTGAPLDDRLGGYQKADPLDGPREVGSGLVRGHHRPLYERPGIPETGCHVVRCGGLQETASAGGLRRYGALVQLCLPLSGAIWRSTHRGHAENPAELRLP